MGSDSASCDLCILEGSLLQGLHWLFPALGLCHCFALPPCVQRQNHTQAIGRKPSASAVIVSDGNTPARWRKCLSHRAASNHWQLSEAPRIPPSDPGPGRELQWETEAFSGNRFILRFLYCAFLSLFFHED